MPPRRLWASDPMSQAMVKLEAATAGLDDRATAILTHHAALQQQVEEKLHHLLPHGDRLNRKGGKGSLGFGQLVTVLDAAWSGDRQMGDRIVATLVAFDHLRNAAAHSRSKREVTACLQRLGDLVYPATIEARDNIPAITGSIMLWLAMQGPEVTPTVI